MRIVLPLSEEDARHPAWWAPLEKIHRAVRGRPIGAFFDPGDFMLMCRVDRSSRPSLYLYKHRLTRRYLNLDADGHAYRYTAARGQGDYVLHRDLRIALANLELWRLPQLRAA